MTSLRMNETLAEQMLSASTSVWDELAELGLLVLRLVVALSTSIPGWAMSLLKNAISARTASAVMV